MFLERIPEPMPSSIAPMPLQTVAFARVQTKMKTAMQEAKKALAINSMDEVLIETWVDVKSLKERFDRHSIGWENDLRDVRNDIKEIRAAIVDKMKHDQTNEIKIKEDIAHLKANNGLVSKFFLLAMSQLLSFITSYKK